MAVVQLGFQRWHAFEEYDQAIERMGLLPGGPGAPEQLFHWVTKTDDGIRAGVDVWESLVAFEQFLSDRIRRRRCQEV